MTGLKTNSISQDLPSPAGLFLFYAITKTTNAKDNTDKQHSTSQSLQTRS